MENRYFEWIAGEQIGNVEKLKCIFELDDEYFYQFESGETCNLRYIAKVTVDKNDLKEKFMVEVNSLTNIWTFEEVKSMTYRDEKDGQTYEIPPMDDILKVEKNGGEISESAVGTKHLIAPAKTQRFRNLPNIDEWMEKEEPKSLPEPQKTLHTDILPTTSERQGDSYVSKMVDTVTETRSIHGSTDVPTMVEPVDSTTTVQQKPIVNFDVQRLSEQLQEKSPVQILVDKCKKRSTQVKLSMNIDLPNKSIYNIASEEFENGSEEFIDYVVSNIDLNVIVESLKESLKTAYEQ